MGQAQPRQNVPASSVETKMIGSKSFGASGETASANLILCGDVFTAALENLRGHPHGKVERKARLILDDSVF